MVPEEKVGTGQLVLRGTTLTGRNSAVLQPMFFLHTIYHATSYLAVRPEAGDIHLHV